VTHLGRSFYARDAATVACALLGQRLVRMLDGARVSGLICEVEAYGGAGDAASHAYRRTPRSAIMYGPPGHAYVYFIYGMHFCLNAVTEADGQAGAVLIRAIVPEEGLAILRRRRGAVADRDLTNGPGKLCQALGIARAQNGIDLTTSCELFIEETAPVSADRVAITPRIGVRGDEVARQRLWRYVWCRQG
jgi:DNA-3-methyladenine glycosylase